MTNTFEKKYGFKEDEKIKRFHRQRRMFFIYKNKLYIAKPNLAYSHATWFEKLGLISKKDDKLMDSITRGIIDNKSNIYFYTSYNFNINKKAEKEFFLHLKELTKRLKISPKSEVFGGLIKKEAGVIWPPRKKYGSIEKYI